MDKVLIDNKYYDPYFILSVTPDDSTKHISNAFKSKAKVLHPDKFKHKKDVNMKKVYKHFNILLECYQFIIDKRKNLQLNKHEHQEIEISSTTEFNNPLDYGYGISEKLEKIDDYDDKKPSQVKIFSGKFNKTEFNKVFEYNEDEYKNSQNEKESSSKELIHCTPDGFFAYNSNDWGNCGLVKSFNGLLIVGDELGQTGKGYSHSNLTDYKKSFSAPKNPDKLIKVPTNFKLKKDQEFKSKTLKGVVNERQQQNVPKKSFDEEKHSFMEKKKIELKQKIKEDEEFVKKYSSSIYSKRLIEDANSRRLKTSSDYVSEINDDMSYDENLIKNRITAFLE